MCFVSLLFFIYRLGGSLSDTETIKRNVIVNGKQTYVLRTTGVYSTQKEQRTLRKRSERASERRAELIDDMMCSSRSFSAKSRARKSHIKHTHTHAHTNRQKYQRDHQQISKKRKTLKNKLMMKSGDRRGNRRRGR
uniref:Putative secreted protein n=1 Tax=Anopheles darlingi TaxID=43151 RepID=A0A2M4D4V8_ANODA